MCCRLGQGLLTHSPAGLASFCWSAIPAIRLDAAMARKHENKRILHFVMIIGTGIDFVDISRIERALLKFGDKFLARILSPSEMAARNRANKFFLAGRFAAKEASAKALGTGFSQGISPGEIEICNDPAGRPHLRFLGHAAGRAKFLRVTNTHLSITHDRGIAAAVVILEN